jgi:hypothetical protein
VAYDYEIPDVSGTLIMPGSTKERGSLRELLTVYSGLSSSDRRRSSILLDQPIPTPPTLRKLDNRETRMNIFDGEVEAMLDFL